MLIRELIDRLLFLVSVPKCVSCGTPLDFGDRGLCKPCLLDYEEHKTRNCSRCARVLSECDCSNFYLKRHSLKKLLKVYRYTTSEQATPWNTLIYSLKQDNRHDVFDFLADELVGVIKNSLDIDGNEGKYLITNVPRRAASIREYGYDHAAEIAKRVSVKLGIEYAKLLVSRAKRPQKGIHGDERLKNAVFDYKPGKSRSLKGLTVILVDDVVTTGASMGYCASLIRGMGTRRIVGASVSIAYKDSYIRPVPEFHK